MVKDSDDVDERISELEEKMVNLGTRMNRISEMEADIDAATDANARIGALEDRVAALEDDNRTLWAIVGTLEMLLEREHEIDLRAEHSERVE